MASAIITTAFGNLQINSTKKGVTELFFTEKEATDESISDGIIKTAVKQISEFIGHKRTAFDIPLDLNGTPFQRSVWKSVHNIPYGTTISYLRIAQQLGDTKKVMAVANAIGKNPVLLLIPCHRVVGSDGKLIGYSGGIERKRLLLAHEGYPFQNSLFS